MLGLAFMPYYVSIREFMNLLPINSFPWSYMIDSQVVLTKFVIYIPLFFSYCVISNHLVIGSIMIMYFICQFYV